MTMSVLHEFAIGFVTLVVWGQTLTSPIVVNRLKDESPQVQKVNDRPIIAVLSQRHKPLTYNQSYLAASYVKYLESSGMYTFFFNKKR